LFIPAPNKAFVYPQKAFEGQYSGKYVYVQKYFVDSLCALGIPALDTTPQLRAYAETGAVVFQRLDGHWTDVGSYEAYRYYLEWLKELGVASGDMPAVQNELQLMYRQGLQEQIPGRNDTEDVPVRTILGSQAERVTNGDMWDRIDEMRSRYGWRDLGPNNAPVAYYRNPSAQGGKRVLLLMDSMFADLSPNIGNGGIVPLLAENVPELLAVWRSYDQLWELIEAYQPEAVIYQTSFP
jgi:hypothetical protein